MLIDLFAYVALSVLLGIPLWPLWRCLPTHPGGYQAHWLLLRPYLPGGAVSAPTRHNTPLQ